MDTRTLRWTALVLTVSFSCLCLAGCKDKRDPLKPTVAKPAAVAIIASAPAA